MISELKGYHTVNEAAKLYKRPDGSTGITRQAMYDMIQRELRNEGSTDLEVLIISGTKFVRQTPKT